MKRFEWSVLAFGLAACLAVFCTNRRTVGHTFEAVGDAEAATVVGGATCVDVGSFTCGEQDPLPDNDCSAATCLSNSDSTPGVETSKENQSFLSLTVCGVFDCGQAYTSQDCTK
jgi:hypothetical protein